MSMNNRGHGYAAGNGHEQGAWACSTEWDYEQPEGGMGIQPAAGMNRGMSGM